MESESLPWCKLNCPKKYCGNFLCKACVDKKVADACALMEKPPTEAENKVRFLRAYDPHPLSEAFRGDITFLGYDMEPVYAHRFIMAGKSAVFRGMFNTNMMEKKSGTVHVDDALAPVLRAMIHFCYTAEILFTEEAPAEEVMKLAHKYDINLLKAVCESQLSEGINKDNLCERLRIAHVYDAKNLYEVAIKFFKENFDEVSNRIVERLH